MSLFSPASHFITQIAILYIRLSPFSSFSRREISPPWRPQRGWEGGGRRRWWWWWWSPSFLLTLWMHMHTATTLTHSLTLNGSHPSQSLQNGKLYLHTIFQIPYILIKLFIFNNLLHKIMNKIWEVLQKSHHLLSILYLSTFKNREYRQQISILKRQV